MSLTGALAAGKLKLLLAGVVVVSAGAGGAIVLSDDGGVASDEERAGILNSVPADVDYVVYGSTDVLADNTTAALYNGMVERTASPDAEVPSYDEALQQAQDEGNLSLDAVETVLTFGTYPEADATEAYGGMLVESSLNESEFVGVFEDAGAELEATTYNGQSVYVNSSAAADQDGYLGVLGDGLYVVGTQAAVEDAIDTNAGDADHFSGDLRESLDDTENGYYEFAFTVPEERMPSASDDAMVDTGPFNRIDVVSGSYFADDDDTFGVRMTVTAANESDAAAINETSQQALALAQFSVEEDALRQTLANVTVAQDGRYVTYEYETTVTAFLDSLELLADSELSGETGESTMVNETSAAALAGA